MKRFLTRKNRRSGIAYKLTKKMSRKYLGIYFFILIAVFILISPPLYKVADTEVKNTLELMDDEFTNAQEQVSSWANSLHYNSELLSALGSYKNDPSERNKSLIEQALTTYVSANSSLLAVSIEDYDHNFFSSFNFRDIVTQELTISDEQYQQLFEYSSGSYYSYMANTEFAVLDGSSVISYNVLVYTNIISLNYTPYVVRNYYNINSVLLHCNTLSENIFSDYAMLDKTGKVLFTYGENFSAMEEELPSLFDYSTASDNQFTLSGLYYYMVDASSGWILITYSPIIYFFRNTFIILGTITALYLFSPLLYNLFLIPTTNRMLEPLSELNKAMQSYNPGMDISLKLDTGDEIESLSEVFKEMVQKINQQIEDIREQEHINSVVNYKLLATQIDPHFIYNTMNIINIMARQGNTNAIVEINSALIKILRERLNSKISITDTVENELNALYQYYLIMDYRYEHKIHISVDVDKEIYPCLIPKNILQPLAENSFYHGFAKLRQGQEGHIDILIYKIKQEIIIEVSDDGQGISPERLKMLQDHSYRIYDDKKPHIGIDNIQQRISYLYGEEASLEIRSVEGYGTSISVTIPLSFDST